MLNELINNSCKYSKFLLINLNNLDLQVLGKIITSPLNGDFFYGFSNWKKLINNLDEEEISKQIRQLKLLVFSHILIRDINKKSNLKEVTDTITKFADFSVKILLEFSFNFYKNIYGFPIGINSGKNQYLSIIAMGKMGGFELNVSSDIDLVFIYPEKGETNGKKNITNEQFFTKVAQKFIKLLNDYTPYGRVFRVDMRLRPNGSSGALVANENSLENYLIIQGSQWERFAWVKARLVTNHPNNIQQIINPFVYKKYSDFSVYESLRDLHKQIKFEAVKKGALNNIKIGIGGIREIEFIAQMFQLIMGGKIIQLQVQGTQEALKIIKNLNIIDNTTIDILLESYIFLRNAEHRLQYWDDQQTQTLPTNEEQQNILAKSMNFNSYEDFLKKLNKYRNKVNNIFNSLLRTNKRNQENTQLKELWLNEDININYKYDIFKKYNFKNINLIIEKLSQTKNSFRYKSLSSLNKKIFDNLIPKSIEISSKYDENDKCLLRLLKFFEIIARRPSYIALIYEYPEILNKLTHIMNKSKLITEILYDHPILLDEILNNELLDTNFNWNTISNDIENKLKWKKDIETQMNLLRDFQHIQIFKLAVQDMENLWSIEDLSDQLSFLADIIINLSLKQAWDNFNKKHIKSPKFAVIGYGKLGSKELSYSSDLDLVYIFDNDCEDAMKLYINFANRLTSLLSSATSSGILYNVDLRLRPNGESGYIASSIKMFEKYQLENAWDWEHQSLSKARFICGDNTIKTKFNNIKSNIISKKRDLQNLKKSIIKMREKISITHKNKKDNIKYLRGGIIDVEFIVQYIILAYSFKYNQLLNNFGNIALLDIAAKLNIIEKNLANKVQISYRFYRNIIHKNIILDNPLQYKEQDLIDCCENVKLLWCKIFDEKI